jgi:hypothetical protein
MVVRVWVLKTEYNGGIFKLSQPDFDQPNQVKLGKSLAIQKENSPENLGP